MNIYKRIEDNTEKNILRIQNYYDELKFAMLDYKEAKLEEMRAQKYEILQNKYKDYLQVNSQVLESMRNLDKMINDKSKKIIGV